MQYAILIKSAHRSRSRKWDDKPIFTCFYLIQLSLKQKQKQKQKQFFKIINETSSALLIVRSRTYPVIPSTERIQ